MTNGTTMTVVIATHDRGPLLLNLLGDLASQDLVDPAARESVFEVLVVDDGSRQPILDTIGGRPYPFVLRVQEQANAGAATARDRGIRDARGHVVVIIDDDMRVPPSFLRAHLERHHAGATLVFGHIRAPQDAERMPLFERFHAWQLEEQVAAVRRGVRLQGASLCTGNVSFRRDDYIRVGGFDRLLPHSEDRDLGIRLELAGASMAFTEKGYAIHHSDHASLDKWKRRAFLYGICDSRIARKHPAVADVDPWHFITLVNPISRPLLLLASLLPVAATRLSRVAWRVSEWVGNSGFEAIALRGATLVYGLEYFRGVREEAGSAAEVLRSLASYVRRARHCSPQLTPGAKNIGYTSVS